jgi:hypothetical protein
MMVGRLKIALIVLSFCGVIGAEVIGSSSALAMRGPCSQWRDLNVCTANFYQEDLHGVQVGDGTYTHDYGPHIYVQLDAVVDNRVVYSQYKTASSCRYGCILQVNGYYTGCHWFYTTGRMHDDQYPIDYSNSSPTIQICN